MSHLLPRSAGSWCIRLHPFHLGNFFLPSPICHYCFFIFKNKLVKVPVRFLTHIHHQIFLLCSCPPALTWFFLDDAFSETLKRRVFNFLIFMPSVLATSGRSGHAVLEADAMVITLFSPPTGHHCTD